MKYSYHSKSFGYLGQPDVKTFRQVLSEFGLTEKEIGEIIMDCERGYKVVDAELVFPWLGQKSQKQEKSE